MGRTDLRNLFVGLAAWLSLAGLSSCVSSDDAPAGGRVEHPDPRISASAPKANLVPPSAQASATPAPSEHPPSSADMNESLSGFKRSPLDKAILKDYPSRPWSKNVPKRNCTDDGECGDGFCDRGRCAAIWTWNTTYGQRCENDQWCGDLPCIDGRCRSCVSVAECKSFNLQDVECTPDPWVPGSHECHGVEGSGGFTVVPGPPLERPKQ
jgi:hypothetical protein